MVDVLLDEIYQGTGPSTLQGYLCCKRRVLEFDEFLKIEGCQIGRHCFIPINTEQKVRFHEGRQHQASALSF